jgi:hypothetical protein
MYLTNIRHDFNFEIESCIEEVQHELKFESFNGISLSSLFKKKILFHTNQGRESLLYYHKKVSSSKYHYEFVIKSVVKFMWEEESNKIYYKIYRSENETHIKYWLLHTFLPLYFLLEKKYEILHAGAVCIDDQAVLFTAPSFGGKSTLTHYFLTKGHILLSDDKLACYKKEMTYYAVPSYPYARNYRGLEDLGRYISNFRTKSVPMKRIYNLKPLGKSDDVSIKPLQGTQKFKVIEMCNDIKLSMLKQEKFPVLNDLADSLEIYEIGIPQDTTRLEEVYQVIMSHLKKGLA